MRKAICILIFTCSSLFTTAQIHISGTLSDEHGSPIAFASITTTQKKTGTISDINGKYSIDLQMPDTVYIYYLGFKPQSFYANKSETKNLRLTPRSYTLEEVTVFPGINPADTIMQRVIKNRDLHNPLKRSSYKHMSYNKFTIEINRDTLQKLVDNGVTNPGLTNVLKLAEKSHLFISEAISEISYKRPHQPKENILTTNISGFKDPAFAVLGNQMQSLSCYDDFFDIANIKYVNPISKNAWKRYLFLLKDTLYEPNGEPVFIITFRPKPGTTFNAMYGMLYIHAQDYAVKRIVAQPASQSSQMGIEIKQEYTKVNEQFWFPKKLQTKLSFYAKIDKNAPPIPILTGLAKTEIINPQIDVEIPKKILRKQFTLDFAPNAGITDTELLNKFRTDSLSALDLNAFNFMDTAMQTPVLNLLQSLPKILTQGTIPIKFLDLNLKEIIGHNYQEGIRLGFSAMTNNQISEKISIGGKILHTAKTDTLWYAARLAFSPLSSNTLRLKYEYQNESSEIGSYSFFNPYKSIMSDYRSYILPAVNYVRGQSAALEIEYPRYSNIRILTLQEKYTLSSRAIDTAFGNFTRTASRIDVRFAPGEQLSNMGQYRLRTGSKYPVFNLVWEKGLDVRSNDIKYNKYLAAISYNAKTRFAGTWRLLGQTGFVDGDIPLHLTFNGKGSFKMPLFEPGVFFTMPAYQFFHTQFIQAFAQHYLPIYHHRSNLMFSASTQLNVLYGAIKNKRLKTIAQPASKGYYEAGILGGIMSPDFGQIVFGAFYNIGAYQSAKIMNNAAIVFGFMTNIDW